MGDWAFCFEPDQHTSSVPTTSANSMAGNEAHKNGPIPSTSSPAPRYRIRRPGYGYSTLCFDGGGYRGYASLLTLRNILRRLEPENEEPIFPYLYFDLICGTSTGGLIAILLAVLHLDIDTAIGVYESLGKALFKSKFRNLRYLLHNERYNQNLLRKEVSRILQEHGDGRTLMEEREFDRGCRCFVTVAQIDGHVPAVHLVRSYPPPNGTDKVPPGYQWTIVDAAMSTAAAPTYFRQCRIRQGEQTFIFEDAGPRGVNNPSQEAWEELEKLRHSASGPTCFVSIGTGKKGKMADSRPTPTHGAVRQAFSNVFNVRTRVKDLSKGMVNQATDTSGVAKSMLSCTRGRNTSYYRFNPDELGDIDLADYKAIPRMVQVMRSFHAANNEELGKCSKRIDEATSLPQMGVAKPSRGWLARAFTSLEAWLRY